MLQSKNMREIWLDIKNFEGLYKISSLGRVQSFHRKGRYLSLKVDAYGYPMVSLYKNKKANTRKVHRLVAMTFIPNLDNKPMVNHKDCNKENNNIDNLEWVTDHENKVHAWSNGLMEKARQKAREIDKNGEKSGVSKLHNNQVLDIRDKYSTGNFTQLTLSQEYGVERATIGKIIRRERWIHI